MKQASASTFVILGMHRSGTSALARCVNILGPHISDSLMTANSFNASGYWEPKSVVEFNTDVISYFDRHWADPKPISTEWVTSPNFQLYVEQATQILQTEFKKSGSVVLKDPRFSRVLPIWREALTTRNADPVFLIAYRNPMDVAQSLSHRDKMGIEHGLQLWLSYMLEAEQNTRGQPRIVIRYEELLRDWRNALLPIFQYAGLPDHNEITDIQAQEIDAFLDPSAQHYNAPEQHISHVENFDHLLARTCQLFTQFNDKPDDRAFDDTTAEWRAILQDLNPGGGRSSCVDLLPKVQIEQSRVLEMKGDLIGALALVKKATSAVNDHPVYQFRLAVLLEKADELESALVTMRDAIRLDTSMVHFHEGLVRVLEKLGYLTEKLTALDVALDQHPQHAQFHYQRGVCLEQNQDLEGALLAMQQAVNLEGAVTRFQIGLARVFVKLKKLDAAISVIRSALLVLPNDAQLHHQLGLILERSGNLDDAKAAIVLATELSPKNERFKTSLVRLSKQ